MSLDKALEAARAMKASNRKRYTSEEVAPILDALIELTTPLEIHDGTGCLEGVCSCGSDVSGGNYCPNCGKRLKWK